MKHKATKNKRDSLISENLSKLEGSFRKKIFYHFYKLENFVEEFNFIIKLKQTFQQAYNL